MPHLDQPRPRAGSIRTGVARARGHPNIRATHSKSIELTGEEEISSRATCVVGVAMTELPAELHLVRGPIRVTLAVGDAQLVGHAVVNPGHDLRRRLIIRRTPHLDADTLAVRADFAADDVDAALLAQLRRPDAAVTMTVEQLRPAPPLVLLGPGPPVGRAELLWRHADASLPLQTASADERSAALDALAAGGTVAATVHAPLDRLPAHAVQWLVAAARFGARLFAPAADAATAAFLAAGVAPAPTVRLGFVDRRTVRQPSISGVLREAALPIALTLEPADAERILGSLAVGDDARRIAVPDGVVDVGVGMRWSSLAEALPELVEHGGEPVTVVLAAREHPAVTADLSDVARALLAAGVPARTLSDALKPWGLGRDQIYRLRAATV